jgi:hypothetical protein
MEMNAKGLKGTYVFNRWKEIVAEENKSSKYKSAYQVFKNRYGAVE